MTLTSIGKTAARAPLAPTNRSAIEALGNTDVCVSTPNLEIDTTIGRPIGDILTHACPNAGTVLGAVGPRPSGANRQLVVLRVSAEFADAFPQGLHGLPSSFTI